jgi:hypothetical protein
MTTDTNTSTRTHNLHEEIAQPLTIALYVAQTLIIVVFYKQN